MPNLTHRPDLTGHYQDYDNPRLARLTYFWETDDGYFVIFRETPKSLTWTEAEIEDWVQRYRAPNPPRSLRLEDVRRWQSKTRDALLEGRTKEI